MSGNYTMPAYGTPEYTEMMNSVNAYLVNTYGSQSGYASSMIGYMDQNYSSNQLIGLSLSQYHLYAAQQAQLAEFYSLSNKLATSYSQNYDTLDNVVNNYMIGLGGAMSGDASKLLKTSSATNILKSIGQAAFVESNAAAATSTMLSTYSQTAARAAVATSYGMLAAKVSSDLSQGNNSEAVKSIGAFYIGAAAQELSASLLKSAAAEVASQSLLSGTVLSSMGIELGATGARFAAVLAAPSVATVVGLVAASIAIHYYEKAWDTNWTQVGNDYSWFAQKVINDAMAGIEGEFSSDVSKHALPTDIYNSLMPYMHSVGDVLSDKLEGHIPSWLAPIVGMQNGTGMVVSPAGNGGGAEPLILDLNGDGAHATRLGYGGGSMSATYFDMDNDGFAERTAWVSSGDGLLVMDKNGNGTIDNQNELFGNNATYANGFLNLQQYDSNGDGAMTSADAQWNNLRVWVDANGDGKTDAGELKTLTELGITRINLAATAQTNVYDNENEVGATGTFVMNGQTRQINDIWFRVDQTSSHYLGDVTLDVQTLFLPTLKGFGNLKDLHVAMSQDAVLLAKVQDFVTSTSTQSFVGSSATLNQKAMDILLRWAGVDTISATATTQGLNTRQMLFLEYVTGYKTSLLNSVPVGQNVSAVATQTQDALFTDVIRHMTAQLTVQTLGNQLFDKGSYNLATGEFTEPLHISAAGFAKIAADLGALNSTDKMSYWTGLTTMLVYTKTWAEFTSDEITNLNNLWANGYYQTWEQWAHNSSASPMWSYNGSGLSDQLIGNEHGSNNIWGNSGDDFIKGGSSADFLYGGDGNDHIEGLGWGDQIYGNNGDDYIVGGTGSNTLYGGSGNDIYVYGGGIDSIYEESGSDKIIFEDSTMTAANISLTRANFTNTDVDIYINGIKSITLYSQLTANFTTEKLEFGNGTFIDLANFQYILNGTSAGEMIYGVSYGGNPNDIISAGDGNDTVYGGLGNDTIDGGNGADTLYGESGDDTYKITLNSGADMIYDTSGNDRILFGSGFSVTNMIVARNPASLNDLTVSFGGVLAATVKDYFVGTGSNAVETLQFSDGTLFSLTNTVFSRSGTSAADSLTGHFGKDFLTGGAGNDYLYGYDGDDTYMFNVGDGVDTVCEQSGNDVIQMGSGITASNIRFEKSGSNLNIYYGTTDKVVLYNQLYDDYYKTNSYDEVETLKFSDGTTINLKGGLTFTGTAVADGIQGTNQNDILIGLAGDDGLTGYDGNDILNGGTGNDILNGGSGQDTASYSDSTSGVTVNLSLTTSQNTVGAGSDTLIDIECLLGSAYNDTLTGDANTNTIEGGLGNDIMSGGAGVDTLSYASSTAGVKVSLATAAAQNTIGAGTDTISGFESIFGSAYNDTLTGDGNANTIEGGLGNDILNGGAGVDTVSYLSSTSAVTVNISTASAQNTGGAGTDTLSYFENIIGSNYNDNLYGNTLTNTLTGGLGDDRLYGSAGADVMDGGSGFDTVSYAASTVAVNVNLATNTHTGGDAAGDSLLGIESVVGSNYNDTIRGSTANESLYGGSGVDTLYGGAGNDVLVGGAGADVLWGETGADTFKFDVPSAGSIDTVKDFKFAESDKIDIKDLLIGYDPVNKAITDFIECTTSGANTIVKVDRDGLGTTYTWQQIATFENVTGLTDEAALKSSGTIIA